MIVVIDYDAGNLRSVETALEHLHSDFVVSADPEQVRAPTK
jgi:glutamine amidotransferase